MKNKGVGHVLNVNQNKRHNYIAGSLVYSCSTPFQKIGHFETSIARKIKVKKELQQKGLEVVNKNL